MLTFFRTPAVEAKQMPLHLQSPCFISDLHLDTSSHKDLLAFEAFLSHVAQNYHELVILGDFFDYWVGDDAMESAKAFVQRLHSFACQHPVYFMHGNRDFLLGQAFADACQAHLIADPCVATIGNKHYLLSHGDLWCTKDQNYQKVRSRVRSIWWQWLMLHLPLSKRLQIAQNARHKSKNYKTTKTVEMMDVVNDSILASAQQPIHGVIHGHTHRPGTYPINKNLYRWVIPDWRHTDSQTIHAGFIVFEKSTPIIKSFSVNRSEVICEQ